MTKQQKQEEIYNRSLVFVSLCRASGLHRTNLCSLLSHMS